MNNNNNNRLAQARTQGMVNFAIILVLAVIVVFVIWRIYKFYSQKVVEDKQYEVILQDGHDGKSRRTIESRFLPTSTLSNEYSISFWLRLNDFTYRFKEDKVVLLKGKKDASNANPLVMIDPHTNNLVVKIKLQTSNPVLESKLGGDLAHGVYEDLLVSDGKYGVEEFSNVSGNNVSSPKYDASRTTNVSGNRVPKIKSSPVNTVEEYTSIKEQFEDDMEGDATNSATANNAIAETHSKLEGSAKKVLADVKMMDFTESQYRSQMNSLVDSICALLSWLDSERDNMSRKMAVAFDDFFNGISMLARSKTMGDVSKLNETKFASDMSAMFKNGDTKTMADFNEMVVSILYLKNAASSGTLDTDKLNKEMVSELQRKADRLDCDLKLESGVSTEELLGQMVDNIKIRVKKLLVRVAVELSDEHILRVDDPTHSECIIKDFPLQKWVHVVVSVHNSASDVYVDGQLSASCAFNGFPVLNTDALHISPDGGYDGGIANVVYVNGSLNQDEVNKLYASGPVYSPGLWETIKQTF
jgi:hypothetical protein